MRIVQSILLHACKCKVQYVFTEFGKGFLIINNKKKSSQVHEIYRIQNDDERIHNKFNAFLHHEVGKLQLKIEINI